MKGHTYNVHAYLQIDVDQFEINDAEIYEDICNSIIHYQSGPNQDLLFFIKELKLQILQLWPKATTITTNEIFTISHIYHITHFPRLVIKLT